MRRLLAAIQFLTIVPAPSSVSPARAAFFFPLVGVILGAAAGAIRKLPLPPSISALLALVFLVVITGALHEDGLADVFDAFRAGRTPERIHAILKDSRIGVYGALALGLSLLLRWQAMAMLGFLPITAAVGTSRGVMVVFAYLSKPAGDGLGKAFRAELTSASTLLAGMQSAGLPFLAGPAAGAGVVAANALAIFLARAYFHRRIGGITGDCLGAICQISETLTLLILLCPFSM